MAKPKIASFKPTQVLKLEQDTAVVASSSDLQTKLDEHISNKNIHMDTDTRDTISYLRKDIDNHTKDSDIHITKVERSTWNSKETPAGAQAKANKVLNALNLHEEDSDIHVTKAEKESFKDKYTKAETRNLLKQGLTGLKFLKAVSSKIDLEKTYPKPDYNSCVYLRYEKKYLVYNGKEWVDFNMIMTPESTEEYDGLMTSEDKAKLDSIETGANKYIHPDNIETRHVSDTQINYWNKKADSTLASNIADGLMRSEDKIKLDSIETGANKYIHPDTHPATMITEDKSHRFTTDDEKDSWNKKAEVEYVDNSTSKVLTSAKSFTDAKIAALLNSTEEQLEVLRSLSFELKKDDVSKKFFDLYNECVKNKEFQIHSLNSDIHMSKSDRVLLNDVKSALNSGLNPDWEETNASSLKYIEHKPVSLPANGGNADTVGGYTAEQLLNKTYYYDYAVESENELEKTINCLNKNSGYTLLIRPGSYDLDKELVIKASNIVITGIGKLSKLLEVSIKIIGNNNIIENITLSNNDSNIVNKTAIYIEGNDNIIRNNNISNYANGIEIEGSNNKIISNSLYNIRNTAINLKANNNTNYGNTIDNNDVKNSIIGISLISSENYLNKNYVTKNNVLNCSTGIVLSNTISDKTKTTMNIINENIVMRGNGDSSEYLSNYKTIASEFSSKNIISSNITSGKEIVAPNDILSNNIF